MPKKATTYAVVDLETTGGTAKRDRITEIGIVLFDGKKIIDQYDTLVNPERSVPPEITRITGITNEMVADAPRFFEVAKKVVEMTEGAIFVAHNVRFDYSFLKEEFASLGYTFTKRQLCTVRLSRKTFPGLKSYSLGNLIRHFGINVNARHRALDDALATTELLGKILKQDHSGKKVKQFVNQGIRESKLPPGITIETLQSLPEEAGVYYFHNAYGKVVYVGKSINIKKRVFQHFSKTSAKAEKLTKMVAEITTDLTGNELVAMLLESSEIKSLQPEINKAQRTAKYPYFIYYYLDLKGYLSFEIQKSTIKNRKGKQILAHYSSKPSARSHLRMINRELLLCLSKCDLHDSEGPCFDYKIKMCNGACIGEESPDEYNIRAKFGTEMLKKVFEDNFVIMEKGRTMDEKAVILIEDGNYRGYGYISSEDAVYGIEELKEAVQYVPETPEANGIIRTYLEKHPDTVIQKF